MFVGSMAFRCQFLVVSDVLTPNSVDKLSIQKISFQIKGGQHAEVDFFFEKKSFGQFLGLGPIPTELPPQTIPMFSTQKLVSKRALFLYGFGRVSAPFFSYC